MGWKVGAALAACVSIGACGDDSPTPPWDGVSGAGGSSTAGASGSAADAGFPGSSEGGSEGAGEAGRGGRDETGDGGLGGEPGIGGEPGAAGEGGSGGETDLLEPVRETGFIELEPVSYTAPFESEPELSSERARLFYSFVPAEEDAKSKPVFVFFNGGPGSTSMFLLSFGTGPLSLDADALSAPLAPNPHSFTELGNLLYIDSRQAGFSYGMTEDPGASSERQLGFAVGSFNAAADGADFVRVLLRVLEKVPGIRDNPVVLVGESYGGTRAAVMLDILLDPDPDGVSYVEPSLTAELEAHYAAVFPGEAPAQLSRAMRARQFGWQVLIQPLVAGSAQYDAQSMLLSAAEVRMAEAVGVPVNELYNERCSYDVARTRAWCDELDAAVHATVTSPTSFEQLFGVAPELVPGLSASERTGAFRFGFGWDRDLEPEPQAWVSRLGAIPAVDRYFRLSSYDSMPPFERAFDTPSYAVPFLRVLYDVNTMITNARLDRAILSDAIVPALNAVVPLSSEPWFTGAEYVDADADPRTRVRLHYLAHDDVGPAAERALYMPTFEQSGHMVSVAAPAALFAEVKAFLSETGLGAPSPPARRALR